MTEPPKEELKFTPLTAADDGIIGAAGVGFNLDALKTALLEDVQAGREINLLLVLDKLLDDPLVGKFFSDRGVDARKLKIGVHHEMGHLAALEDRVRDRRDEKAGYQTYEEDEIAALTEGRIVKEIERAHRLVDNVRLKVAVESGDPAQASEPTAVDVLREILSWYTHSPTGVHTLDDVMKVKAVDLLTDPVSPGSPPNTHADKVGGRKRLFGRLGPKDPQPRERG